MSYTKRAAAAAKASTDLRRAIDALTATGDQHLAALEQAASGLRASNAALQRSVRLSTPDLRAVDLTGKLPAAR